MTQTEKCHSFHVTSYETPEKTVADVTRSGFIQILVRNVTISIVQKLVHLSYPQNWIVPLNNIRADDWNTANLSL